MVTLANQELSLAWVVAVLVRFCLLRYFPISQQWSSGFLIIECNGFYLLSWEYFQIWFCLLGVYSLAPWPSPTRLLNLARLKETFVLD